MKTIGKFDSEGQEIFVGDKIIHAWGWFNWEGKGYTKFMLHTITEKPAHRMNNGEMHDDGNGVIFCMGNSYNFWKGKEVTKLTEEDFKEINLPEDTYIYNDGEKWALFEGKFMCGTQEKYDAFAKEFNERERKFLFGDRTIPE